MSRKEIRVYKRLLCLFLFGLLAAGTLSRCANPAAPQGGPRDTLPPKVIAMTPAFGTTHFKDNRIYIEFDEYVKLKDQQKEFYVSPFLKKQPSVALHRKGIRIDIREELDSNQTYSLNFGQSVVDNNEENPYTGLRYVFSTGSEIDSLLMSGYTVDAYTTDTVGSVFILFYDAATDSVPQYDSTLFKSTPRVVSRSMPNGIFLAENLKGVPYRVYALEDNNGNKTYEPGVDRVAFLDSIYNPLHMPEFGIWYDTLRQYLQADPQLLMNLFMDTPFKRQTFGSGARPKSNQVDLFFTAPHPEIDSLYFEGIDPSKIVTEYKSEKRDTITLWFDLTEEQMPDTLRGTLLYERHDSLSRLYTHTQELKLGWRTPQKRKEKKGDKNETPKNPFKVSNNAGSSVNPEKHILFTFDYPLTRVDSNAIQLEHIGQDSLITSVPFRFAPDTLHIRQWEFSARWQAGEKYRLTIPAGALANTNAESNDTIRLDFDILSPDKFATLILNVRGETPESEYIVQILNENNKIIKETAHITTGRHTFYYLDPGTIRVKVIQDRNANGKWDTGSLIDRRQPERAELFVKDDGSEEIPAQVNWEVEYDADMAELFGPVTQQRIKDRIRRSEEARMRKLREQWAEKAQQQNQQTHDHNNGTEGMNGFGGMGGMNGGGFRTPTGSRY